MTILTPSRQCYLQVIDVLLGVQVDATGPLLDGHDWEANIDAAMEFAFLDLRQAETHTFFFLLTAQFIQGYSEFCAHLQHTIKCKETKEWSLQLVWQVPLVVRDLSVAVRGLIQINFNTLYNQKITNFQIKINY